MRRVIEVNDYQVTSDDPNDWVSMEPGTIQLVIVSHYHYYRTGMKSVDLNGPAGANEEVLRYLPEGDNDPTSVLIVEDPVMLDESTFACTIDASKTKAGDNFIVYFRTWTKDTVDWRWPKYPIKGGPRSFQIHVHIGESMEAYVGGLRSK